MKTTKRFPAAPGLSLAAMLLIGCMGMTGAAAFAQGDSSIAGSTLPPVQTQGQVEFLTGGIGKDESDAIKQVAGSWPLMLELARVAVPRAEYISDAKITIRDKAGSTILEMTAEGPYVLVKLPPGNYSLDAVFESKTIHRRLSVGKEGSQKVILLWPAPEGQAATGAEDRSADIP